MNNSIRYSILLAAIIHSHFSMAQRRDTLEIQHNKSGKIIFARFQPDAARKLAEGAKFLQNILAAKPEHEFRLVKETTETRFPASTICPILEGCEIRQC